MSTALITGASAGIGLVFAEQLASQGYDLVLVARRADRLQALARRLEGSGHAVEVLVADLGTDAGVARVEERIAQGSPCDLVINNAGFASRSMVANLNVPGFHEMMLVNMLALVRISSKALQRMTAEGRGAIINVASGTVFMQLPGNAGYGASKSFVMAFTRNMQLEAQGTGVQVQLLIPGVIATEFHEVAGADLARFPPQMVMQAGDLVAASLKALAMSEPVCIPSLPEITDWEAFIVAEQALAGKVSCDHPAARYGQ